MNLFVVQTHPGRDALACSELRAQIKLGVVQRVLMPTYLKRRIVRGRVEHDSRPTFSGYLFVGFAWTDNWAAINSTRGVKRLMGGLNPLPLRPLEADLIEAACVEELPLPEQETRALLNKLVRIVAGPFKDYSGTCESIDGQAARVMVTMFGRSCPTSAKLNWIEAV